MTAPIAPQVTAVTVDAPFTHSTGAAVGRFLTALRDDRVIWGRRCDDCRRVVVPATDHCDTCATPLHDWVEVGPAGTVTGASRVDAPLPLSGLDGPVAVLRVRLDGADTDLVHLAASPDGAIDPDRVRRGDRVVATWAHDRMGSIRDLAGFVPEADAPTAPARGENPATDPVTIVDRRLDLPFRQTAGTVETRFRHDLRRRRIHGNRCTDCRQVYVPPRPHCPKCWATCDGWVEVADTGTVTTFVVVNVPFHGQEIEIPYVLAQVLLDGADATILHLVGEQRDDGKLVLPAGGVRRGLRVKATWRDERVGLLNDDIDHFAPTGEPDVPVEDLPR